jgi:hypothetical protein
MTSITVVLPAVEDSEVAFGLRRLTRTLVANGYGDLSAGLGGEDGYGVTFENEVFSMHPYCWCEQDACAWCANCTCTDAAWTYLLDGAPSDYDGWFMAQAAGQDAVQVFTPNCHWCLHPELKRANFEHKASGTKITWYKYLGRSMELSIKEEWTSVLGQCLASITPAVANS